MVPDSQASIILQAFLMLVTLEIYNCLGVESMTKKSGQGTSPERWRGGKGRRRGEEGKERGRGGEGKGGEGEGGESRLRA